MKKIILQFWEQSEKTKYIEPDGCSLHLELKIHKDFVEDFYKCRINKPVPIKYNRVVGNPIEVMVSKDLYELLLIDKSLVLEQYQLNNLIKLDNILF